MATKEKGGHSFLLRFARSFMPDMVGMHVWQPRQVKTRMAGRVRKLEAIPRGRAASKKRNSSY